MMPGEDAYSQDRLAAGGRHTVRKLAAFLWAFYYFSLPFILASPRCWTTFTWLHTRQGHLLFGWFGQTIGLWGGTLL